MGQAFTTVDKTWRLYRKHSDARTTVDRALRAAHPGRAAGARAGAGAPLFAVAAAGHLRRDPGRRHAAQPAGQRPRRAGPLVRRRQQVPAPARRPAGPGRPGLRRGRAEDGAGGRAQARPLRAVDHRLQRRAHRGRREDRGLQDHDPARGRAQRHQPELAGLVPPGGPGGDAPGRPARRRSTWIRSRASSWARWKPSWPTRKKTCSRPSKSWRPATRSCRPPTRSCRPRTRSCRAPTRSSRASTKSCTRSTPSTSARSRS